jgi:hypothetical protein
MQEAPDWSSLEFVATRRWQAIGFEGGSSDLPRRWRLPLLVLLIAVHAAALRWFPVGLALEAWPLRQEQTILVEFIDPLPATALLAASVPKRPDDDDPSSNLPPPQHRQALPTSAMKPSPRAHTVPADTRRKPATSLLFADDGRVRLPDGLMDDLDKQFGERRQFDFQVPGLGKKHALLEHRSALAYEATRFDKDWKSDQDLLTELLSKAVEATTKEVRMPMPGNPRATLVCRVSMLAMGGGCGIEHAGADYLPPGDDPKTLTAAEARECQAWWEKIVAAKTQEAWLRTRELYEGQCRKPLLREKPTAQPL